jgi:hypothetical protein
MSTGKMDMLFYNKRNFGSMKPTTANRNIKAKPITSSTKNVKRNFLSDVLHAPKGVGCGVCGGR